MRDLDETDRELLRILLDDGRASYRKLAETVGLSPPAVSDRLDRLRELNIIERFTVNIDRSRLHDGVRLAVTLTVTPGNTAVVREALTDVTGVEHVFVTADSQLFIVGTFPDADIESRFGSAFRTAAIEAINVAPLTGVDWHPILGEATLGLDCVECGNTVTAEGVSAAIGGERYEFCCDSCRARFEDRYEELSDGL